jgi:hypothetical protein
MSEPTWHDDGHTMTLVLEQDSMHLEWCCPFRNTDMSTVSYDDRPHCRQDYDEDGQPQHDSPPLTFCNVGAFITADIYPMECTGFDVPYRPPSGTFRIEYRWANGDECYLWRPVLPAPTEPGVAS